MTVMRSEIIGGERREREEQVMWRLKEGMTRMMGRKMIGRGGRG